MNGQKSETILRLAAWISFVFALVNHLLRPKAFAATQILFDYHGGFQRRGLAGEVLNLFAGPQISSGEVFAALALITAGAATGLFWFLLARLGQSRGGLLFLIVLTNSFAFASLVGNVGYLDGVLVLLAIAACASDPARPSGLWARVAAMGAGVLVHENMLPYFALLMAFELWLAGWRWQSFAPLGLGMAVVAASALGGSGWSDAAAYGDYLQSKAGFAVDPEAVIVAARRIGDNFALMEGLRGQVQYQAWLLFDGLPLLALALWALWLGRTMLGAGAGRGAVWLLGLAVLAPLSLNIVAFDVVRFGVASVIAAALAAAGMARRVTGARDRLDRAIGWPHFALALVMVTSVATTEINEGRGHLARFPWVLIEQAGWAR